MSNLDPSTLLARVQDALTAARMVFDHFDPQRTAELKKTGGDPVTVTDIALDRAMKDALLSDGEGWLSEETADDQERLDKELVWIVDPLDGTREFIDGLPEYCTSVAAVVDGVPVAGGIVNPAADLLILGGQGIGVTCNGEPMEKRPVRSFRDASILASRSEVARGQWSAVEAEGLRVEPMGSVAYKMARVAAGLADVTWTPVPKHEWDVAAGSALLAAAGGRTLGLDGRPLQFNRQRPWLSGMIAIPSGLEVHLGAIQSLIALQIA